MIFVLSACMSSDGMQVFSNERLSIEYNSDIFEMDDAKMSDETYDFYIQDSQKNAQVYIWSDKHENLSLYKVSTLEELAILMVKDYLGDQFDSSKHLPLKTVDIDGYKAFVLVFDNGDVYIIEHQDSFIVVDGSDYTPDLKLLDDVLEVLHSLKLK